MKKLIKKIDKTFILSDSFSKIKKNKPWFPYQEFNVELTGNWSPFGTVTYFNTNVLDNTNISYDPYILYDSYTDNNQLITSYDFIII